MSEDLCKFCEGNVFELLIQQEGNADYVCKECSAYFNLSSILSFIENKNGFVSIIELSDNFKDIKSIVLVYGLGILKQQELILERYKFNNDDGTLSDLTFEDLDEAFEVGIKINKTPTPVYKASAD